MAKNMAEKKNVEHAPTVARPVVDLNISEISADHTWNARGNRWQGAANDEDTKFSGLVDSIKARGLDEAVLVRPNPDPKARQKYSLVYGFRRFEAISKIAAENNEKSPTIRAEIRAMNEVEARSANIRENTVRDNLAVPDLAWAIYRLGLDGNTDVGIASEIGKTQGYVSMLNRIVKDTAPKIVENWRSAIVPLTVGQMNKIRAEKTPEEQIAMYTELVEKTKKKEPKTEDEKVSAKLDALKKKALDFGILLGKLDATGHLDSSNFSFDESILLIFPASSEYDARKRKSIAKEAEKGWKEGHDLIDEEENAGEVEEEAAE